MAVDRPQGTIDFGRPRLTLDVVMTLADHIDFDVDMRERPMAARART